MISGTVIYDVRPVVNQLFAAPGVTVSIYNADTTQTVWLSTRQSGLRAGLGIPLPPNGLIAWDADKDCYAVSAGPDVLVAVTDNSGALNFQGPTLTQITAAVPSAATIDGQPNSANAAASAAASASAAAASASAAAAAASNSAIARIRSMTRVGYFMPTVQVTLTIPISVTDINRCQVNNLGSFLNGAGGGLSDLPAVTGATNTAITLTRGTASIQASGYIEVMEWI